MVEQRDLIDEQELVRRMEEGSIEPEELSQYVEIDPAHAGDFDPRVRARSDRVAPVRDEPLLHGWLNDYARYLRQRRFQALVRRRYDGLRIVSEGDSWFQYPVVRLDIIDHLSARHAIFSLGRAGDTLETIIAEQDDEIFPALKEHKPHVFLISGGGNDMVGGGHLAELVGQYSPVRPPRDYAYTDAFDAFIERLTGMYEALFRRITDQYPGLHVIFHGYDAPIPGDESDPFLGAPLIGQGIVEPGLQHQVMHAIMRRYNDALAELADRLPRVHHVDCMGSLRAQDWGDSMHPSSRGAQRPAARINRRIIDLAQDLGFPVDVRPG